MFFKNRGAAFAKGTHTAAAAARKAAAGAGRGRQCWRAGSAAGVVGTKGSAAAAQGGLEEKGPAERSSAALGRCTETTTLSWLGGVDGEE